MSKSKRNKKLKSPQEITVKILKRWSLPRPMVGGDKDSRGRVLVIGGCDGLAGAIVLSASATLRAGAGKLQIATPASIAPWIAITVLEALVVSLKQSSTGIIRPTSVEQITSNIKQANSILIGPGMEGKTDLVGFVRKMARYLKSDTTLVLDAEALKCAKDVRFLKSLKCAGILTPHAGEMADILGCSKEKVQEQGLLLATQLASETGFVVVLKGPHTLIVDPDGETYQNRAGNTGLGTSGSGDTLAGIIAGLSARGALPVQAAVWGVSLHARAGDLLAKTMGPIGYLPSELLAEIPKLMERLGR